MSAGAAAQVTYTADALRALNHSRPPRRCIRKILFSHWLWSPAAVRHVTRRNVNINRKARALCLHPVPRQHLRTGWLNVRSLGNKTTAVCELIADRQLDIAVLSETWHRSPGDILIRLTTPPGYTAVDAVRPSDPQHGGLAVILRANFIWSRMTLPAVSTFECLGVRVAIGGSSLVVIAVYRPGSARPAPQFFTELATLLESVALLRCPLLIGGDFNIHVEDPCDANGIRLTEVLNTFGLTQRVHDSTHQLGGTLDVVIAPDDIASVSTVVDPPGVISDHGLVVADLPIRPARQMSSRTVRSWKAVDRTAFAEAIADSPLGKAPSPDNTSDELFSEYEQVLTALADSFAPSRTVQSKVRPLSPWFDSDCRAIRRTCRRLEKRFRRSYADVDRLAWIAALRKKNEVFEEKKAEYWRSRLATDSHDPRRLWRHVNSVLCRGKESGLPPPPVSHSADDFQRFFVAKVENVRAATAASSGADTVEVDHSRCSQPSPSTMTMWRDVTESEVRRIVLAAPLKSCSLDPIPTFVLRDCIDVLLPYLTAMVNSSLREGRMPESQKKAIVTPLLKKPSLDPQELKNYRPVSNLSFVSKLVERVAARQLMDYLTANNLMPKLQSAYRRHHSTETAMLKVLSDVLLAADNQKVTLLALLDLSAAFDCVDHDILLHRLQSIFGLGGKVIEWLRSFLTGRTQQVLRDGCLSEIVLILFGVPQGSVIGPILFILYVVEVFGIIASYGLDCHSYADDTQVYISVPATVADDAATRVTECITHLDRWMTLNRLKLNADKTQLIWLGTRQQLAKLTVTQLQLSASVVEFDSVVTDLGVVLDNQLTMGPQVTAVSRSCFYQMRQLRVVQRSLTNDALRSLVQAFIHCRLDYCNALLAGITDTQLKRLQSVQNTAARLVSGARRRDHITPVLRSLHWLPVRQRIFFKTAVLVWKCIHGVAPPYLQEACVPVEKVQGRSRLRSASTGCVDLPRVQTSVGQRSFAFHGPTVWNSLPSALRDSSLSLNTFKRRLKTYLFGQS